MRVDAVFKALADTTRRHLLDRLFAQPGMTQGQLEEGLDMTRYAVAKHLRVLAEAELVVIRRVGRKKHHYLNPVPIQQIQQRWLHKYMAERSSALLELKRILEDS